MSCALSSRAAELRIIPYRLEELRQLIGKQIRHYNIVEKLGEGGMGVVYKAEDTKLKRTVALKFLPLQTIASKEAKARFQHEAQAAAALDHPNICTVYEINEANGQAYIAMAYVEGHVLNQFVGPHRNVPLRIEQILDYGIQIAEGLQAAHEKKIVHRDIKPANILLTEKGHVRITDFGLAKLGGRTHLTKEGMSMGTVAYMSPEQTQGAEVDHRTDIWALGAVIYELITGQQPFAGDYEQAVIYSIMNEDPVPPTALRTDLPMELERIVAKALAKEPKERYQQVGEMLVDLKNLRKIEKSGFSKAARPRAPSMRVSVDARKLRSVYVGVGIAVATALIVSSLWWLFKPSSESQTNSIAVLPFKNLNRDLAQEYFSDGMTETIISNLANFNGLAVISRTSVMPYKDSDKNTREISKELNVGHILEGSVLISGKKLRIFAQLIDAETDANLWAQTYDREITDIFSIQSDVANQIATVLQVALGTDARARIAHHPTTDFEAYRFYLKGEFYVNKQTLADIDTSIVFYGQAIARDPDFALAYAALANAYMWKNLEFDPNPQWEERAYVAVNQALSLEPGLAEANVVRGMLYWSPSNNFAHEEALKEYEKAITLKPGLSTAYRQLSLVQRHIGLLDEALITGRKSIKLDPGNYRARRFEGQVLFDQGKYAEALAIFEKLPDTFAPSLTISLTALSLFYLQRVNDAAELIELNLLKYPTDPQFNSAYSIILASLSRNGEARQRMELALENAMEYIHIHHIYHNLAGASALMGEHDKAVKWLNKAVETGLPCYPLFNRDPNLQGLKGDASFDTLMLELKKRWEYYNTL